MAQRKVVWTDTAKRQRRAIFDYWNNRNQSKTYSEKLRKHIQLRIVQIVQHPNSGKETTFSNTRITSLGHFSLVYRATQEQIIVFGFWDTRQDPDKLLKSLT
jgi:plasmid stabilization system protein ParE